MERVIHIAFGSNLGDREANIKEAIHKIRLIDDIAIIAMSDLYISDPEGENLNGVFLNCALAMRSSLEIDNLHSELRKIEQELGRKISSDTRDRFLDIDIIFVEGLSGNYGDLTLPHPRYAGRKFVVFPLLDISDTLDAKTASLLVKRAEALSLEREPLCLRFKSMLYL